MPKIEYKNIGVCHIKYEDNEKLKMFIEKNLSFASINTLVFDNLSNDMMNYLDSKKITYILSDNVKFSTRASNTNENKIYKDNIQYANIENINYTEYKDIDDNKKKDKTTILHRVIRSGEFIESNGDIIIFNRVNSTAKIKSHGNVFIYGQCDGDIECNGECILLSKITNGKVVFNSEVINADMLKYRLNLISKKDNKLIIQDIDTLIA